LKRGVSLCEANYFSNGNGVCHKVYGQCRGQGMRLKSLSLFLLKIMRVFNAIFAIYVLYGPGLGFSFLARGLSSGYPGCIIVGLNAS
jgi:hypothetical protein